MAAVVVRDLPPALHQRLKQGATRTQGESLKRAGARSVACGASDVLVRHSRREWLRTPHTESCA